MTRIAYLLTNGNGSHRAITLSFRDGQQRIFAPYAEVPDQFVADLLKKQVTIGGCCGKQAQTVNLFATEEQLETGERTWIS